MQKVREIDVDVLPKEKKRELLDFYEYLVHRYGKSKTKSKESIRASAVAKKKALFFESADRHSFKLPKGYRFNREELHER